MTYQIITDATADLNEELLAGLPEVRIIPMHLEVGGKEYLFGPGVMTVFFWGNNR